MVLIAESGSTKCDWLLYQGKECVFETSTAGFNPYFHSEDWMVEQLQLNPQLVEVAQRISSVYFFGAGCSMEDLKAKVNRALNAFFLQAQNKVDHDLTAAAYATYDGRTALSCILGTGSNACRFDGKTVYSEVPSLAFILGDEGSGSYFGKKLLAAYFYKQLPDKVKDDFDRTYPEFNMDILIQKVYRNTHANVYLASFMPFVYRWKSMDFIQDWLQDGFKHFLDNQVLCYDNVHNMPIHFVGSVAKLFQPELEKSLEERQLSLGQIVKKPAHALANFVLERHQQ
ncbi:MAG: hypothetical protein GVY20_02760 [Bacteroidetes bacterium]|jgi:N-acetylglucosamine kinase-like BadF-type ATPase|nr:hypothetical protein [Bacteroidota bacterium]